MVMPHQDGRDLDLIRRAIVSRESLREQLARETTDVLRLVNGAADGLPGTTLDAFGLHWLLSTQEPTVPKWVGGLDAPGSLYWKVLSRDEKRPPVHVRGETVDGPFVVSELGLRYEADFLGGYSQGLFHDQRDNRRELLDLCKRRMAASQGRPVTLLNTFAYTCAFSVAAASAGVFTTSIDLSGAALDRGRRNFVLNGISQVDHHFMKRDVFDGMRLLGKQERRFDFIILDPPTFSRSKIGGVFRATEDYPRLLTQAIGLLAPGGSLLASSNARGLDLTDFAAMARQIAAGTGRRFRVSPRAMPPDFRGDSYLKSLFLEEQKP